MFGTLAFRFFLLWTLWNYNLFESGLVFNSRYVHRTNRRAIAMMFVRPFVCPSVRPSVWFIVIIRCMLAWI